MNPSRSTSYGLPRKPPVATRGKPRPPRDVPNGGGKADPKIYGNFTLTSSLKETAEHARAPCDEGNFLITSNADIVWPHYDGVVLANPAVISIFINNCKFLFILC